MIPIIYEKGEIAFTSNGLGRLRDCLSCTVTEEKNGIFECNFSYPVTGANYDLIKLGRIIGVTHDDSGTIQPFDIISFSKPINGVVSFRAVHISYRLSGHVYAAADGGANLAGCLELLQSGSVPPLPFTLSTDGWSPAGYCAAMYAEPRTVRAIIGGSEGSLLDTFGGEVEWNNWQVIFHASRGVYRDFKIRYGVNMTAYNDDTDYADSFTACVPYWTDGTTTITGGIVYSGTEPFNGVEKCLPLDLSSKFETAPSTSALEAEAFSYMQGGQVYLPKQTITVEFARLQDLGHEDFAGLYTCELCDTIAVDFPAYRMSGQYKIVKTVWDALTDRYDEMTLGALSTTLSDALGISATATTGGSGGGGIQSVVVTPSLTSGTQVAEIEVDGASATLYAPTPPTASSTMPLMDGNASAGSGTTYARGNHRHPTDTTRQEALVSGTNIKTVNGESLLGSGDVTVTAETYYGTSSTAAATVKKEAMITGFPATLKAGLRVTIKFTYANGVANPTLSINSGTAVAIKRYGTTAPSTSAATSWNANSAVDMVYDGTYWQITNWNNTTYSAISQANIESLTATSAGLITGQRLTQGVAKRVSVSQTLASGTEVGSVTVNGTETKLYAPPTGALTATAISLHALNGTYTPAYDGKIVFVGRAAAAGAYIYIDDSTDSRAAARMYLPTNGMYGTLTFPVLKGHTYKVTAVANYTTVNEYYYTRGV